MHKSAIDLGAVPLSAIVRSIDNTWRLRGFRKVDTGIVNPVYELNIEPRGWLILKIGNPLWAS
jgi:hypothetical protein